MSNPWEDCGFDGAWIALGETIEVREPATGDRICRVGLATAKDVARAADLARGAQPGWAAMALAERAAIFRKAADIATARHDEIIDWIVRETGAIPPKAEFELGNMTNQMLEAAAMLAQPRGLVLPALDTEISIARRVPHGVVGIITPFNFPLLLTARALFPALACGNAVVLKPDARTPVSGGLLIASILSEAGLPAGVVHVLPGAVEAGEALVTDPNVAMISFTGSTAVGRRVGELAGRHLKKVALELGGKNALIILDDADLDVAASNGAFASFFHQGQICMSAGRHLVHASVADSYAEIMAEKARNLPVGDPARAQVALGPIISDAQVQRVNRILNDTLSKGAQLLAGGPTNSRFFPATVIDGVTPEMAAFREEFFGPIVSITRFETDDEAVALANDSDYGLSAGIMTSDMGRGRALAERLRVGLVHVNDQTVNDNGLMPMGGQGASGNGSRHGGPANWDEFSQWQWLTLREKPHMYPF